MNSSVIVNNANYRGCRTSAIESAMRCPFSVQKVYRDKIKGYIDSSALRGSAVHDCLEEYGRHCLKYKRGTDFQYIDAIIMRYACSVPSNVMEETYSILQDSKEFVNFQSLIDGRDPKIEERYYLDKDLNIIEPCDDAFFSSAIDYHYLEQDGKIAHVFDYKTSRKIYSESVLKTKLQKDFYSLLIFLKYPDVEYVNFYYDFIRYGKIVGPITFSREKDFDMLKEKLLSGINEYYKIVNTDEDLEARPSSFCSLCEVKGLCPRFKNGVPEECIVIDEGSAANAARLYKSLKLRMKLIKDSLDLYLSNNKNIAISEVEGYGISAVTKESVKDIYELYEELIKEGVPIGAIFDKFTLTKKNYLSLIKKTNIVKSKYLKSNITTKTDFYDLESDDEDEGDE